MIEIVDKKCWVEDYPGGRGAYSNRCLVCLSMFLGHKGRRICKLCDTIPKPTLTDEEKKVLLEKIVALADQIAEHEKTRTEYIVLLNKEFLN